MTNGPGDSDFRLLQQVAPGTALRDAIELIIKQDTGGLIVLGADATIDGLVSGGFDLSGAAFTPQKLAELAKMDGAIVLDEQAERILKANVQLNPDPSIETNETGMRRRAAERVAKQTGRPVVAVSEGREVAIVYTNGSRYVLQAPTSVLAQANQNLQTLERFRRRLDEAEARLTRSEVGDTVVVRDVIVALQRAALVLRLGEHLTNYAVELGDESQLLSLQIADLVTGVDHRMELVYRDYSRSRAQRPRALDRLTELALNDLNDLTRVASAVDLGPLDSQAAPQGLRILADVPRLPDAVEAALLGHFSDFQVMLHASANELGEVEGVGRARARQLRRYFDRLLELSPGLSEDED